MGFEALIDNYVWVDAIEGWTVSVMGPRRTDELVRIFGRGQAVPLGEVACTDVDRLRGPDTGAVEPFLQVAQFNEYTVAFERDGWSGAFPEIARRCSAAGGWFFSVYWNVNAAGFVTRAVDGVITAQFESLYPLAPAGRPGERRPEWAIGPEVGSGVVWQACMALLEQETGIAVQRGWLGEPWPTFRIPEPYHLYGDIEGADRI
jgi:hypothetical protein